MASRQIRDSGRHRLSAVASDLDDYVATVFDGAAIEVELTYGRVFAVRLRPDTANVARYGTGGGLIGVNEMSRVRLRNFIRATVPEDPEVRRGSPGEVWPF